MKRKLAENLLEFIRKSPSCYHVVSNMGQRMEEAGFSRLYEEDSWQLVPGGKYYVTRGGSSLIAFSLPEEKIEGFQLMASHSDSPAFKVKENGEITVEDKYVKLNVEKYGGMLMASWFDRPLSLAGRVMVEQEGSICTKLVQIDRDLLLIPSLAIHMNRKVNEGYSYNVQKDLQPLFGMAGEESLKDIVAKAAGTEPEKILGSDLFLYNRMSGSIWGAGESFLSSPKLDDLQCAYASLEGFLAGNGAKGRAMVHCVLDNEEVGSSTRQGAGSTFLQDVLVRTIQAFGGSQEDYLRVIARSFLISADNAHSVHPNQTDKADSANRPCMNGGPVIKYSANQKYTTDSATAAVFTTICKKAGVPVQRFTNRSDMEGGSTLGNISAGHVPVPSVDIGLPQLAMHSCYETGGVYDTAYLVEAVKTFFSSEVSSSRDGVYVVK